MALKDHFGCRLSRDQVRFLDAAFPASQQAPFKLLVRVGPQFQRTATALAEKGVGSLRLEGRYFVAEDWVPYTIKHLRASGDWYGVEDHG